MRRRAWIAIALGVAALVVAGAGRGLPGTQAWNLLSGLLAIAAIALALSLLAIWGRLAPAPMPGLFTRPTPRERWCGRCGHPTAKAGACRTCGHDSGRRRK